MNDALKQLKLFHAKQRMEYPIQERILEAIEIADFIHEFDIGKGFHKHIFEILKLALNMYPENLIPPYPQEFTNQIDLHIGLLELLHDEQYFRDARERYGAKIAREESEITRHNLDAMPNHWFGKDIKQNIL